MEPIATYSKTREIIDKYGFSVKKAYGQNFLVDLHVMEKIIKGSNINQKDLVIEIGPGFGGLTQVLAENAGDVIAVEIDKTLIPILQETLAAYDNIRVIQGDILKLDLHQLILEAGYKRAKVVANLPYYIATPIIMEILEKRVPVESLTVMVQREVGERMRAKPSTKDYGALTLAVNYYAEVEVVANVPKNSFIPRPNVDSIVIKINIRKDPAVQTKNEALLFSLIKAGFGQRRKTFVNCIYNQMDLNLSKEAIGSVLLDLGYDINVRGESLALSDFAVITDQLNEQIIKV